MEKSPAEEHPNASGLNLAELTQLPDSHRHLLNWMRRNGDCSLPELLCGMGEDEGVVRTLLDTLLEKGFVRKISGDSGSRYRVNLAAKRARKLPLKLQQALEK